MFCLKENVSRIFSFLGSTNNSKSSSDYLEETPIKTKRDNANMVATMPLMLKNSTLPVYKKQDNANIFTKLFLFWLNKIVNNSAIQFKLH